MKSIKTLISGIALTGFPMIAFAQGNVTIFGILARIKNLLDMLVPLLIAGALVYFIWGIIKYVISSDSDDKAKAREVVVRGLIGFFVIISLWGIIGVIQSSLGIGSSSTLGTDVLPRIGS